jgi:hypothetical protein
VPGQHEVQAPAVAVTVQGHISVWLYVQMQSGPLHDASQRFPLPSWHAFVHARAASDPPGVLLPTQPPFPITRRGMLGQMEGSSPPGTEPAPLSPVAAGTGSLPPQAAAKDRASSMDLCSERIDRLKVFGRLGWVARIMNSTLLALRAAEAVRVAARLGAIAVASRGTNPRSVGSVECAAPHHAS